MAANLDRAETSLTAVSDIAYIRGIDGSGNSVRISKADLASVLGGMRLVGVLNETDSWDDLNVTGYYVGNPSPGRSPFSWSHILNFVSPTFKLQIIFENGGSKKVCYRSKWGSGDWTDWSYIG